MRLTPATALAFVAVLLTLSGGAYAAKKIRSKDIGTGAVASRAIKNGSVQSRDLTRGVRSLLYRKARTGPRGSAGPRGATGSRGPRGYRGHRGATGPAGPAGPAGTVAETLPAGRTARGVYVAGDATSVSFPSALPGAPKVHFVAAGATAPPECPGNATTPAAAAGNLCVYEGAREGAVTAVTVFDPARGDGDGAASRYGFGLRVTGDAAARSTGSWAATAA